MGFIGLKMSDFSVVHAAKEDLPQICEIYRQSVLEETASWEYDPPDIKEFTERFNSIVGQNYPYLVAKSGDTVLGYAYVSNYRTRSGYRFCVENSIYVDKDYRGNGVASTLLGELILKCKQRGFKEIIAVIGDSENISSQKLHEKLGFVRVGLLPKIGFKFDRWLDSVIMQMSL